MIILGANVMARDDHEAVLYYLDKIIKEHKIVRHGWNGFSILQRAASRVGGMDIGFVPAEGGISAQMMLTQAMDALFLLGADEMNFSKLNPSSFIVYIGHHGDTGAHYADIVLPGAAYTEKEATYVNLEGRPQRTNIAAHPPGQAMADCNILLRLADILDLDIGCKTIGEVRKNMESISEIFKHINHIEPGNMLPIRMGRRANFTSDSFIHPIRNFYMTDPISRHSKNMAKCSIEILNNKS